MQLKKFHTVLAETSPEIKNQVRKKLDRLDRLQSEVGKEIMIAKCKEFIDSQIEFTHVITLKSF